ncbi:hypothetical protein NC652_015000 [Populus alba x Populus x berolinensis]|uniref:Uncharacterized protein n=1 Tax=Populus alba x Populus x berolinensis TaxID=444605 RepID=A0AAD6QYC6_9ROSI|nr:hypothetical protein NC651_014565 [Populus alba x Populus x berolinensis]KAJ6931670.1 hypothetical protein NC652_014994 [Populus alba x Populus x berolinensis]KAJ6931677.1 hypothetical protein NC652_015000 [Populus alba x Populus x berolinensis]KAJ6998933.1 hypothetical protein NC653_014933 [Populus alba x Populus x berolinensis]KAJ6998955.1 hypothetical protein NC653_014948 [Populus alba x Populus x berolinensis]
MLTRTNCALDKLHVTSKDNMFRKVSEAVSLHSSAQKGPQPPHPSSKRGPISVQCGKLNEMTDFDKEEETPL